MVSRVHDGGSELGACLREEYLESEAGGVHLNRQLPSLDSNFSDLSASNSSLTAFVEKWSQHVTKRSGVVVQLISAIVMVVIGIDDGLNGIALLVNQNLAALISKT